MQPWLDKAMHAGLWTCNRHHFVALLSEPEVRLTLHEALMLHAGLVLLKEENDVLR